VRDDVEELDLDLDLGRSELAPTYHGEAYDLKLENNLGKEVKN
jgi:hypothetical protein